MKKWIALSMSLLMLLSAGCGSSNNPESTAGGNDISPVSFEDSAITGEITVSAYDTMQHGRHLNALAKAFEAKYPGTKINVQTFSAMPEIKTSTSADGSMSIAMISNEADPEAEQNYLHALNTEMMGGGGADVFAIDVLPYYKYADAGQLLDMQTLMDSDPTFNQDDYYMSVLNAMKYNGGQYIMPIDFSFLYLTYNPNLLDDAQKAAVQAKNGFTYDELIQLGSASFEAKEDLALLAADKAELFSRMFAMNASAFIDLANKRCDFTSGAFEALLNNTAQYESNGYLMPMPKFNTDDMLAGATMESGLTALRLGGGTESYFATGMSLMLMNHFNTSENGGRIFFSTNGIGSSDTADHEIAGLLLNDDGNAEVEYMEAYGINANTKNPRLAWEFIKFMLSEEMQLSMLVMGTPVNKAAAEESAKQQLVQEFGLSSVAMAPAGVPAASGSIRSDETVPDGAIVSIEGDVPDGEIVTIEGEMPEGDAPIAIRTPSFNMEDFEEPPLVRAELDEEQTEIFNRYMAQLNAFLTDLRMHSVTDAALKLIVENETAKFFSGEAAAAAVATTLQNKIGLILSEQ